MAQWYDNNTFQYELYYCRVSHCVIIKLTFGVHFGERKWFFDTSFKTVNNGRVKKTDVLRTDHCSGRNVENVVCYNGVI